MSRFLSAALTALTPYVPGEQPKDMDRLIKLNTNELPYPPSPRALAALNQPLGASLRLYNDPDATALRSALAGELGVSPAQVLCTNGSDEALAFAMYAFADRALGVRYADVTYGFYPVLCKLFGIPATVCPLREDLTVDPDAYIGTEECVFLANPNAQTGLFLPLFEVERIIASSPRRVVVVDEAYVDFGGESAVSLLPKYDNLLVVRTFSKSRALAGLRVGFAVGSPALIGDMEAVRRSFHPYNVGTVAQAVAKGSVEDREYFQSTVRAVILTRERFKAEAARLGCVCTDSMANFVALSHPAVEGRALYEELRTRGILVRYFAEPRVAHTVRISIGTPEQMERLILALTEILRPKGDTL